MKDSVKDRYLAQPEYWAERAYDSLRERLITVERIYAKGVPKFEHLFSFMADSHEKLGILAYFVHHDMAAFKEHWALASKLWLHASRHLPLKDYYMSGGETKYTLAVNFLYPLVSDDARVIEEVAALESPVLLMYRNEPKAAEFDFHLAQLVIRGDYEAAQAKIALGAKKGRSEYKQAYASGTDVCSLVMKGDKAALESL
ncbi:MAG: hypothetical protein LBS70_01210, partial [Candidatus Accumulibacter sp.]|nr:hypothetical protein [Accumulibacter sp.]